MQVRSGSILKGGGLAAPNMDYYLALERRSYVQQTMTRLIPGLTYEISFLAANSVSCNALHVALRSTIFFPLNLI